MAHTQYVIIDNNYFKDVQNPYMIDIYEINLGLRSCTIKTHTHTHKYLLVSAFTHLQAMQIKRIILK